ncbi:MAG TPA: hypothetical protein VF742_13135 [Terracidiphilus sp.]
MSWYPQIGSGTIAQLPVSRSRKWRVIANSLESGEQVLLPDTAAGRIEWDLSYQDLNASEAQSLSTFFSASQGGFVPFGFVDPMANLLGWSESLLQSSWQQELLQISAGARDPLGAQRASTIANPNPGSQALEQTLGISGDFVACFSAYLFSSGATTVTLQRDAAQVVVNVGPRWTRACLSGRGANGAAQSTFSLVLSTGQTLNVWGLQVEAQPYPSAYKPTNAAIGIYEETYFAGDELTMTSTAPGLSSCEITLLSRV